MKTQSLSLPIYIWTAQKTLLKRPAPTQLSILAKMGLVKSIYPLQGFSKILTLFSALKNLVFQMILLDEEPHSLNGLPQVRLIKMSLDSYLLSQTSNNLIP